MHGVGWAPRVLVSYALGGSNSTSHLSLVLWIIWLCVLAGLVTATIILLGGVVGYSDQPTRRKLGGTLVMAGLLAGVIPTFGGAAFGRPSQPNRRIDD